MNLNMPIYRAKKIDSDGYIEGYLVEYKVYTQRQYRFAYGIKIFRSDILFEVNPTTLAIHFPDMLDSEGNKIFASLQEDGKGGDILYYDDNRDFIALYKDFKICLDYLDFSLVKNICNLKIKGIKE